MPFDLLIRNGTVVTESIKRQSLAIVDGRIVEIAPEIPGLAADEIDATGLHVLPGLIDPHVHFNEPGRTDWEGLASGSAALAAGGGTCFFDMPLNSTPPLFDAAAFHAKRAAAEARSHVDFGLWGGLTPLNLDRLAELADCGVVGFKAFMCHSGVDEFPYADDATLLEGMRSAAALGLPVAVHAESEEITRSLTQQAVAGGQVRIHDFLASRPVAAELDAFSRAIEIAGETRCALHIVHVSCGRGVALVSQARARGIDVTCETCPHYLLFSDDDLDHLAAVAKCAPPLRSSEDQNELWDRLIAGEIDLVASDHSPCPPDLKGLDPVGSTGVTRSFFEIWGGIAGCQSTLPILLMAGRANTERGRPRPLAFLQNASSAHGGPEHSLPQIARLTSGAAAGRFAIADKGELRVGFDADLTLVDLTGATTLSAEHLLCRHKLSPYVGLPLYGLIRHTFVRGQHVFADGRINPTSRGRLVAPSGSR